MLPKIAEAMNLVPSNKEGWLTGLLNMVIENKEQNHIELGVCFPVSNNEQVKSGMIDGIFYYSFVEDTVHEERYDQRIEQQLKQIVDDFKPEVIHIFGTEFAHTLAMVKVVPYPERILIAMQGVCSVCAEHYLANIPERICKKPTFRDVIKKDNLLQQQQKFYIRAAREKEALQHVSHVTGRTAFDKSEVFQLNPNASYHFMNETLRSPFYNGKWSYETCMKHSLFLSQGNYPLKGAHFAIEAIGKLKEQYPNIQLRIAGDVITNYTTLKDKIKIGTYGLYLRQLIKQYKIEEHVLFLGKLTAEQMKEEYLRANAFVCPSIMENSPNALGEAMILGMPTISANVGGIPSMISQDDNEGILFASGNSSKLADCIQTVFEMGESCKEMGENARKRALITHDGQKNYERLIEIYQLF